MERFLQVCVAIFFIYCIGSFIHTWFKAENCYVNKIDTKECREAIFNSRGALK